MKRLHIQRLAILFLAISTWQAATAAIVTAKPTNLIGADTPAAPSDTPEFRRNDVGIQFYRFSIDQDALSGAPDQSALNQPLDNAARMFVRGSHFYRVGPDGRANTGDDTRLRLYGINLSFATNFPSDADAVRLAKRLRKLGFNAVRLHHMDTSPGTEDNPPRSLLTPGPYPSFNPVAVARLRNFIGVLKQEGIYVNLNLHVGYRFRPAVDQLPPLDNKAQETAMGAPVNVYYPRMVALQEDYARQLIRALNLRGNPALAMVEINNESSLLAAWQRREWSSAVPKAYEPELKKQWQAWVMRRYGAYAKACNAWKTCSDDSAPPLLTPIDADYAASKIAQWRDKLSGKLHTLATRLLGPSDPGIPSDAGEAIRLRDFLQFLADTDRAYFERMRRAIHEETDPLVPVTGTQMSYGGALNFDSQSGMDYIDEHFYIDHPDYPGKAWDRYDWRFHDSAASGGEISRILGLALRRDARKPFVVSEFNQPFPNRQSSEIQPLMAAVAAAQDWDGLFFFDYMDGDNWSDIPSAFTLAGDWGKFAQTGQSALIFRRGLVAPLPAQINVPLQPQARLAIASLRDVSAFDTHLAIAAGVTPELAAQARIAIDVTGTAQGKQTPIAADAPLHSPNGQFDYVPLQRTIELRTDQMRAFIGFLQTRKVGDAAASATLVGKGRGFASILVTALDNRKLDASRHLLISTAAAVTGTQAGSSPQRPKEIVRYKNDSQWMTLEADPGITGRPSGARDVEGPVWMERSQVQLNLRTQARRASVYPLDGSGKRMAALGANRVTLADGVLTILMQADPAEASPWYEVVADE